MPYLLMLLGALLFGFGFWMLQQKPKHKPHQTEVHSRVQNSEKPKPTLSNKEKGDAFEKFVVGRFNKQYFKLKQWQGDKFHGGRFAEANKHPDLLLEFHLKETKEQFAVECKWKAQLTEEHHWAEDRQIENYQKFGVETGLPVFVVLGFGGNASHPDAVYVVPLDKLKFAKVTRAYLQRFQRTEPEKHFFYDVEKKVLM